MSETFPAMAAQLADYRALRRQLEEAILPLATSVDGRRFTFQAPLHDLRLQPGGYVELDLGDRELLGQVLGLHVQATEAADVGWRRDESTSMSSRLTLRLSQGDGVVLDGNEAPFHDAAVRPAEPEAVDAWLTGAAPARAGLPVGAMRLAPGVSCRLDAGGFNRHTFLCGQSGSGKTYALGVLLEQLLLQTNLRIVVLDPNSDFVRLADVRAGVPDETAERYRAAAAGVVAHRAGEEGQRRLRVRFPDLGRGAQAAALRLDPIADREEYATLTNLLDEFQPGTVADLSALDRPDAAQLATRARNLGIDRWSVWARADAGSTLDALEDPDVRCLVVDLGSLPSRTEQVLAAGAVLERLWEHRARREPMLIVIDEAHNVCPAEPADRLSALATDVAITIAAEGRKFGLYLLVSTQRPQKVPENVISQCDNLVMMRMNSAADLAYAGEIFSFVPTALLEQASSFRLGEALVAGKLASHPTLVRMGSRIAEEGGADVPTTWADVAVAGAEPGGARSA
jgi:DNA helicase HerA-like ATPase